MLLGIIRDTTCLALIKQQRLKLITPMAGGKLFFVFRSIWIIRMMLISPFFEGVMSLMKGTEDLFALDIPLIVEVV